jgi:signal transduction histidine kinase
MAVTEDRARWPGDPSTHAAGWPGPATVEAHTSAEQLVQVAHDLRSPLTSILVVIEQLRSGRSGPLTPRMEQQLAVVHDATLGMAAVVADLLSASRDAAIVRGAEPEPFSLKALFGQVRDLVQPLAERKGLSVRLVTPTRDKRVGYPSALRRVLLNLATNAVKFTDHGGVDLIAEESLGLLRFSVRDTGRGTGPEALDTGSGLGLPTCRRLVNEMGGELDVSSAPAGGSTFSFCLAL